MYNLLSSQETQSILDNLVPNASKTKHLCLNEIYKALYDLSVSNTNHRRKYAWITVIEYEDGTSKQIRLPFAEAEKHLLPGRKGLIVEDFDEKSFYTRPYKERILPSGKIRIVDHEKETKGYRDRIYEIRHLVSIDSSYVVTEISYSLQKRQYSYGEDGKIKGSYYKEYDRKKRSINIFNPDKDLDEFFLQLRKGFENEDKIIKINGYSATIAYGRFEKQTAQKKAKNEKANTTVREIVRPPHFVAEQDRDIPFAHPINANVEEIHLTHSPELSIPFRIDKRHSAIDFDATMFPCHPVWEEQILRPVWYIEGCDYSSRQFDSNTFYFYINRDNLRSILIRCIKKANRSSKNSNTRRHADSFIKALMSSAFVLYYINTSNGWDINDLSFDTIWNLMNYILFMVQPFDISEELSRNNWIKSVTLDWMIYKAKKYYAKLTHTSVVKCYEKFARTFSSHYTQCMKPKEWSFSEFSAWKTRIGVPRKAQDPLSRKQQVKALRKGANQRMARNAQILSLYSNGKTMREIASILDVNYRTVCRIIKSNPPHGSMADLPILIDNSLESLLSDYMENNQQ